MRKRSAPYPMLTTFDAPRFNTTCTVRTRSNTPLQSLTMANDQTMIENARSLGARLIAHSRDDAERIEFASWLCFSRQPELRERRRLLKFVETVRQDFREDPESARVLIGEPSLVETDAVEKAVWYTVARALMNLDEFITRE